MIFNQATDYGFRIILFLSKQPASKRIEAVEISETECIPERFLFKIMRKLSAHGLVKSFRGVNGGFTLGRKPEEIKMLDVVEAVEGPVFVNVCFKGNNQCSKSAIGSCVVHHELAKLRYDISTRLKNIDFKTLVEKEQIMKEGDVFSSCSEPDATNTIT
ncbi:RrF2 family transcriptional regulator [Desulfuribacillus alkaliarsenatis]|uniref:Rrf2 family transcriptional regulator n=1 Tax=Desulfuribacillus alkaliarsenatis TaxID=766136 RepID=A0A1E5G3G7_9FIRM|nr:Rrf2 family transcriptional regulator [Desulfuribacillus alkaliarsenatis]OEF97623.1 hypothetical protein BHF68_14605 [Desulfuribacillus alkaliarsenatis]